MAKSQSSSRSAGQKVSKASNAIRRAISATKSAVKVVSTKQSHAAEE